MKKQKICLALALLAALFAGACSRATDNRSYGLRYNANNNSINNAGNSKDTAEGRLGEDIGWFTDLQLSGYGAAGIVPPFGFPTETTGEALVRIYNSREEDYRSFVYSTFNKLQANNERLYTLSDSEDLAFVQAQINDSSAIMAGPNMYYYKVGDKVYAVLFNYTAGNTPSVIELSFSDVTDKYGSYQFR
ncbi:MAG: hypothetical protein FWG30_05780 [Eubacteriaceae bacterium]|nr:hypothetical protein [Eubacteriaceae bacterium]